MSPLKQIAVIPGDGIGPEVIQAALAILDQLKADFALPIDVTFFDWGADKWLNEGVGLPDGAVDMLHQQFDAILFGAVGDPRIPDTAHGREILLGLRNGLGLTVNYRPVTLYSSLLSPLKVADKSHIDIAIFRENTQGLYSGVGGQVNVGQQTDVAIDQCVYTRDKVRQTIDFALRWSRANGKSRVTMVDKANAVPHCGQLWRDVFAELAQNYADIETTIELVDACAMNMVLKPEYYQVIVTSNLFGDILSDLAAALIGGPGLAGSANINPDGTIALFEPVHGSAPDLVGKNQANPAAAFITLGLMLDYLGLTAAKERLYQGLNQLLVNAAEPLTPDLGGTATSDEFTARLLDCLRV